MRETRRSGGRRRRGVPIGGGRLVSRQFVRFALVGVLNTAVDYAVFAALFRVGDVHYALCQVAGYGAGVVNSFVWNRRWTFDLPRRRRPATQFLRFVLVNLVSLGVAEIGLAVLIDAAGMPVPAAKVLVTIAAQFINFLGYKLWVFAPGTGRRHDGGQINRHS